MSALQKKLLNVQRIMAHMGVKCWLLYSEERSDHYLDKLIGEVTFSPGILILTRTRCALLIGELDRDNAPVDRDIEIYVVRSGTSFFERAGQVLAAWRYPESIALNYSSRGDAQVDVLGHGIYQRLTRHLRASYRANGRKIEFRSADELVYAVCDQKASTEVAKMRVAARRAAELLESALSRLKVGMTELDAAKLVHSLMTRKPAYFESEGVVAEETAWERPLCPIVLAGPSLAKGGHALPGRQRILRGHTVYFDFGVKLTFVDGSKWSSDLQRMGYVLRTAENAPPAEVLRMFNVIRDAVDKGIKCIRPGMFGFELDKIVRGFVMGAGFPDYGHSTGHAIGESAHNPGTLLGQRGKGMSRLRIQRNGVYTIEPRIALKNGASIEEMVLVGENGGEPLCERQRNIFLISGRR